MLRKFLRASFWLIFIGSLVGAGLGASYLWSLYLTLPDVQQLNTYQPRAPLKVYSADGVLVAEFGEERRQMVTYKEIPPMLVKALVAAEDKTYFAHHGIDWKGVARAAYANYVAKGTKEGASTITMQVARNFFLTKEKTLLRKVKEAMLAYKMEEELNKEKIMELYVNQIFLGQKAYGFASAAQIYFHKRLPDVTLSEIAFLAALPKAPSRYSAFANNQFTHFAEFKARQHYVLERMLDEKFITQAEFAQARQAETRFHVGVESYLAPEFGHLAEMARQYLIKAYGEERVYTNDFKVHLTVTQTDQRQAYQTLLDHVLKYTETYYQPKKAFVKRVAVESALIGVPDKFADFAVNELNSIKRLPPVVPGMFFGVEKGLGKFATEMGYVVGKIPKRLNVGEIYYLWVDEAKKTARFANFPELQGALIAMEARTGKIISLAGGTAFEGNNFNRVTDAYRQPGSSFKPFVYAAALEKGFTPLSRIANTELKVVLDNKTQEGEEWSPKNYDGSYSEAMTMKTALAWSKNIISVRLIEAITPEFVKSYVTALGFDNQKIPPVLSLALGSVEVTPWQMAAGYGVFANGGVLLQPKFIAQVTEQGKVLEANDFAKVLGTQVISDRNAFSATELMKGVIINGTGSKALALKRGDLAGKTGTTNNEKDLWFVGFSPDVVGITWLGFDLPTSLGPGETGGDRALPLWMDYMRPILKRYPENKKPKIPQGLELVAGNTWVYTENVEAALKGEILGGEGEGLLDNEAELIDLDAVDLDGYKQAVPPLNEGKTVPLDQPPAELIDLSKP